jgi:hypothetical protein
MVQIGQKVLCLAAALAHTVHTAVAFTPDAASIGKQPLQVTTDRRSAAMGDLDRKSELERRVEHGMFYEHDDSANHGPKKTHAANLHDNIPIAHAHWVGYRFTVEERLRLKSANVY